MLQWSYGSVCPMTAVAPVGKRSFGAEQQVVAVDHARGVDLAGDERAGGVALAADVVAVETDADVEAPNVEVAAGSRPAARRNDSGISVACGESIAPVAMILSSRSATVVIPESAGRRRPT